MDVLDQIAIKLFSRDLSKKNSGEDFFEVSTWGLKEALQLAYMAGVKAAGKPRKVSEGRKTAIQDYLSLKSTRLFEGAFKDLEATIREFCFLTNEEESLSESALMKYLVDKGFKITPELKDQIFDYLGDHAIIIRD